VDTLLPAKKFFNRQFRTHLQTLQPYFDPILHVEGRKQFKIGDRVRIQNAISKRWDNTGSISKIQDSGQSYYVDRDIGQDTVLCNNIFLKVIAPPFSFHESAAVDDTQISSGPLPPLAMPAVAVPAVRESNVREHPNRVHQQPVRFAP
jgi:hypothetical protein